MTAPDPSVASAMAASHERMAETNRKIAQAFRRTACAQRTEQQIRAIVRDEIRLFVTGDES